MRELVEPGDVSRNLLVTSNIRPGCAPCAYVLNADGSEALFGCFLDDGVQDRSPVTNGEMHGGTACVIEGQSSEKQMLSANDDFALHKDESVSRFVEPPNPLSSKNKLNLAMSISHVEGGQQKRPSLAAVVVSTSVEVRIVFR